MSLQGWGGGGIGEFGETGLSLKPLSIHSDLDSSRIWGRF